MRFFSPDTRAVPVVRLSLPFASLVSLLFLSALFANTSSVQAQEAVLDAAPATAVTPEADATGQEDTDDAAPTTSEQADTAQTDAVAAAAPADAASDATAVDAGDDVTSIRNRRTIEPMAGGNSGSAARRLLATVTRMQST
jgi:hypothetical protein